LSGHKDGDWLAEAQYGSLQGLLSEIGRTYAPFLMANAKAVESGAENFETKIDGRKWQQPPFPYQAKCLVALRDAYQALSAGSQNRVDGLLTGTGCETLFGKA